MSLIYKLRNSFIFTCLVLLSFALIPVVPVLADAPVGGQLTLTTTNNQSGITTNPVESVYTITPDLYANDQLTSLMVVVTDSDGDLKPDNVPVYEDGDLSSIGNLKYQGSFNWLLVPDPGKNISFALGSHSLVTTTFQYYDNNPTPLILTINYNVVQAPQTITFGPLSDASYKSPITLNATASSGLPVSYTVAPSNAGTFTGVAGNIFTPNTVSTVTITANQVGNSIFSAATPVPQALNIGKSTPTSNLPSVTNVTYDGTPKPISSPFIHPGTVVTVTYNGSASAPTAIGSYNVIATSASDTYHNAAIATGTLVIDVPSTKPDPIRNYLSGSWWGSSNTKFVTSGDYDGDGKTDLAMVYDYGNSVTGLWVFQNDGNGGFTPSLVWKSGSWWGSSNTKFVTSGDYDGDGKTEIAIIYSYGNSTGLWDFSNVNGVYTPRLYWQSGSSWSPANTMFAVSGDYNADGRDDLSIGYDYGNSVMGLWDFVIN